LTAENKLMMMMMMMI